MIQREGGAERPLSFLYTGATDTIFTRMAEVNDMRLFIDGDAFPFIGIATEQATRHGVEFCIVANDHKLPIKGLESAWITVPSTPNGADIAILEMIMDGDIVLTDDKTLAYCCLENNATPLGSDGGAYDLPNPAFRQKRKPRAMSAEERKQVKRIKGRLLELRLSNVMTSTNTMPTEEINEELEVLAESNGSMMRWFPAFVWTFASKRRRRGRRRRRIAERAARARAVAREIASEHEPRAPRPKPEPYAVSSACSREIREIIGEFEWRFQSHRKALHIEAWKYKERNCQKTAGRDQEMAECDLKIAERDLEISKLNHKIAERDREIAERDQKLAEQASEMAERDQKLAECYRIIGRHSQEIAERDRKIGMRNREISKRDQAIVERDRVIAEQALEIARLTDALKQRENNERGEQTAASPPLDSFFSNQFKRTKYLLKSAIMSEDTEKASRFVSIMKDYAKKFGQAGYDIDDSDKKEFEMLEKVCHWQKNHACHIVKVSSVAKHKALFPELTLEETVELIEHALFKMLIFDGRPETPKSLRRHLRRTMKADEVTPHYGNVLNMFERLGLVTVSENPIRIDYNF
jgi:uncharacterized protein YaiI (UPF0178 family)